MKKGIRYISIAIISFFVFSGAICYFDKKRDNKYDQKGTEYDEWHGIGIIEQPEGPAAGAYLSIAVNDNNVYISYMDAGQTNLAFVKSTNRGLTWDVGALVDSGTSVQYTSIAVIYSLVYISYYDAINNSLKFAKSAEGGEHETWNLFTLDDSGDVGRYSSIAVDEEKIYISYQGGFAKSIDEGATWSKNPAMSGQYTSIAVDSSNIYYSYYDSTGGDLKFAKSTDAADSWPATITVDGNVNDGGKIDGNVGRFSSIAVNGNDVYIAYYSDTDVDLKFAKSSDGGATWNSDNVKIIDIADAGNYLDMAIDGNNIYISYYDTTNLDLRLSKSADGGETWEDQTVDSEGDVGSHSSIAVDGNRVYIIYHDTQGEQIKFAKSINSGETW